VKARQSYFKPLVRLLMALGIAFVAGDCLAGVCKRCNAKILGSKPFCSRCVNDPDIKKMLKEEADRARAEAKARAERKKRLETKLGIKSFLGFEFLSLSDTGEKTVVKPLKREFRGYREATLSYTTQKRLYKVEIMDSVPNRTNTEIEAELTSLSKMFEKKYNFKFESPLACSGDVSVKGGGLTFSGGKVVQLPREVINLPWRTWRRQYEWQDCELVMEGRIPVNGNMDENTHVSVSFTMKGVDAADRQATIRAANEDEKDIDAL